MATQIDSITGKVAKELGISELLVDQINRVQYKFLMDTMQGGTMTGVSMIYLGKFHKSKKYGTDNRYIHRIPEPNIQG